MDKIKIVADFAPELSECAVHLFSYVSLHDCKVLINFCYTALGLLFFNPVLGENHGIGQKRLGTL